MDVHRPGVTEIVEAPDLVQKLIPGVDPVGGGGQEVQKLHLLGGCGYLLAVQNQLVGLHINNQLVKDQTAGLLTHLQPVGTAKHRLHPGKDLLHLEGLGNIIVCAGLQTHHLIVQVALGGEHNDGCVTLRPDNAAEGSAVHHRHHQIQQNDIRLQRPELLQTLHAVGGGVDGIAVLLQV